VKHVISRPKSKTLPYQFKSAFWTTFLDEASRQVVCSSMLSDLTSPLSFDSIMGLCVLDIPWPDLVPTLSTVLFSAEEQLPVRTAAAHALRELVKLKSALYAIPQVSTFASVCLDTAAVCEHEKFLSSLFNLLAELPISDPLAIVNLALERFENYPTVRPAALYLIGAQCSAASSSPFPDGLATSIAKVLNQTLKCDDSSPEVLHEALAMCANLVEVDIETGSDSRGHVQQYMASVLPALLDRFSRGAPISLIVDASLVLNLMTSLIPGPIKGMNSLLPISFP
jgi:hypothetical protein